MSHFSPLQAIKDNILYYCNDLRHQGRFVEMEMFLKQKKNSLLLFADNYYKIYYIFLQGVISFNRGDFKSAIKFFQDFLQKVDNPSRFPTDETYYYLIRAFLHLRNEKNANHYLNLLTERLNSPMFILLSIYFFDLYEVNYEVNLNLLFDSIGDFQDEGDLGDTQLMRILASMIRRELRKDSTPYIDFLNGILRQFEQFDPYCNNYYFTLIKMSFLFHNRLYDRIINLNDYLSISNSCDLINIYCAALYKQGYYDECIKCLNKLILCNSNFTYKINLAKCYIQKKEYVHALKVLNQLHDRAIDDYKHFLKGICRQKLGLFPDAIRSYKKITNQSKFFDKAMLNMAAIYYDNFDYRGCLEILKSINSPRVTNHDVYLYLLSKVENAPDTKNISAVIFFASCALLGLVAIILVLYIFIRLVG